MNNKETSFEIYRYQLLPIDRFLQWDLLTNVRTIDQLMQEKNNFFYGIVNDIKNFSDSKHETITKKLYSDGDFFLFRLANNKSIHRETKEFKDEIIDNWPSVLVAIWNNPEKQIIAIQKRSTAFSSCEVVVKLIGSSIYRQLAQYHLRMMYEPLFETQKFWDILQEYEGKVKSVEFELITPNMANISGVLPEELKGFAKHTNATKTNLKIDSDQEATLHLKRDNPTLAGLVEYSGEGGGNISLKIDGIKKKYQTSRTVKEFALGEVELQGDGESIARVIKEILK